MPHYGGDNYDDDDGADEKQMIKPEAPLSSFAPRSLH